MLRCVVHDVHYVLCVVLCMFRVMCRVLCAVCYIFRDTCCLVWDAVHYSVMTYFV